MADRRLPSFLDLATHTEGTKPCLVCTTVSISTVEVRRAGAFACLVIDQPGRPIAAALLLDPRELEAAIILLRQASEDAELLNLGKAPVHALGSGARN